MPSLESRTQSPLVKLMMIGNSGTGKTGSLASLALAGYKLHILDFDNGLEPLINHIREKDSKALANVDFMSFRDNYKPSPTGPAIIGPAKAFQASARALDKWEDGTKPEEWGPGHICIIDSLTSMGRAAFAFAHSSNPTAKEPRQWFYSAQDHLENILALLTAETFNSHVIVLTHIDLITDKTGNTEGFASAIGKAMGPKIPRYFNTLLAMEKQGMGKAVRRRILTFPTAMLTLKNPAPMKFDAEYPIETGLASIFRVLSGQS